MLLVTPHGGASTVYFNDEPILSKAHSSNHLILHVPLSFSMSAVHALGDDVAVELNGAFPGLVFEDEGADDVGLSLVKPEGAAELHLLGGRLLVNCTAHLDLPSKDQQARLDFSSPGRALISFAEDISMQNQIIIAISYEANGTVLVIHGGNLVVDGDGQRPQSCNAQL